MVDKKKRDLQEQLRERQIQNNERIREKQVRKEEL